MLAWCRDLMTGRVISVDEDLGHSFVYFSPEKPRIFIELKHWSSQATGSGKMQAAAYELAQDASQIVAEALHAANGTARLALQGDLSQRLPFEMPLGDLDKPTPSRKRVEWYRTLLGETTHRGERDSIAPVTLEIISWPLARRALDQVALAMRAFSLLRHYAELVYKLIRRVEALRSMYIPPAPTIRVDELNSSRESHRSRAPGRPGRPRLVCRELAAV